MMLITGPAGTGKTALTATLARSLEQLPLQASAIHHCRARLTASTDPIRLLANVAAQLTKQIDGYAELIDPFGRSPDPARPGTAAVLDCRDWPSAAEVALYAPLRRLAETDRLNGDVLVIIDGLDEGTPECVHALTEFIRLCATAPPPRLRLLVAARPYLREDLSPLVSFDLIDHCPKGVNDLAEYVAATKLRARHRTRIVDEAAGSYVYARLAAQLTRTDRRSRGSDHGPDALGQLLDDGLALASLDRSVLDLVARSRDHGLTAQQVAAILGAGPADVDAALTKCTAILIGTRHRRPFHRCISEHLERTSAAADRARLDWTAAQYFLVRNIGNWKACEPYGLRNLLPHLADAAARTNGDLRREAALRAIGRIAADPEFLASSSARVGVDDLLSSIRYARRGLAVGVDELENAYDALLAQSGPLRSWQVRSEPNVAGQQLMLGAAMIRSRTLGGAFTASTADTVHTLWATTDVDHPDSATNRGHQCEVSDIAVTADGVRAVTIAKDSSTKVWWLASGRLAHELPTSAGVNSLWPTADGLHVATASGDGRLDVWDLTSGGSAAGGTTGAPTTVATAFAVNADSTVGLSADIDGDVTVWSLITGEPSVRLRSRSPLTTAVALSADGRLGATAGATAGADGTVLIWDTAAGVVLCQFPVSARVRSLALGPHAAVVVVGTDQGLAVYEPGRGRRLGRLLTNKAVTAVAVNAAMPRYALFGTESGQIAYVRLPSRT